jgi:hypothetical protein
MIKSVKEISSNMYHVIYDSQGSMNKAFMRPYGYYFGPFQGKTFSHKEYKDYYKSKYNKIYNRQKRLAFFLPSYALNQFYTDQFEGISKDEKELLDKIKDARDAVRYHTPVYYVIATLEGVPKYKLRHVAAHGLKHLYPDYWEKVKLILNCMRLNEAEEFLRKKIGYPDSVMWDEINAHIVEGDEMFEEVGWMQGTKGPAVPFNGAHYRHIEQLNKIFDEYYKGK